VERRVDIHSPHSLPAAISLLELLPDVQPCVLDHRVEAPEALEGELDRPATAVLGLEILDAGLAADLVGDRLGNVGSAAGAVSLDTRVVHDHVRPARREDPGICGPEPAAGAGHEDDLLVEANLAHARPSPAAAPGRRSRPPPPPGPAACTVLSGPV
jgi:hypothetical protein